MGTVGFKAFQQKERKNLFVKKVKYFSLGDTVVDHLKRNWICFVSL